MSVRTVVSADLNSGSQRGTLFVPTSASWEESIARSSIVVFEHHGTHRCAIGFVDRVVRRSAGISYFGKPTLSVEFVSSDQRQARRHHGRKEFRNGAAPDASVGRVPRLARLMDLAIRCDQLIRDAVVADQSELARLGHITTARMTQIMTLLNLTPDLQEEILYLPRTERGRDVVQETDVRPIAAALDWGKQRRMWAALRRRLERDDVSSR